ncbi:ABC transporter ATP-binding protein [Sulfuriroseicoccus oceanibius]|uniref:ABC transporter ATP-binding protein n=1 Tax=Sulfuriroseicoccus oceanibius TaxID=2707525 RepID=A0A6B3L3N7_9BACT|nr:ABC transporter ATP-binding protein [Sulfuriroseicoccus oceanibius]QQL46108.1 ABC transporter ATP-binding protein [Sulfuriroseicoccus oceanibius]
MTSQASNDYLALEIENLCFSYAGQAVLRDYNLSLAKGEILALLGESGCGKTTVLRIAAGLLAPDSGRVLLNGKDITHALPERRNIGLVFQDFALFPHMTVEQNIRYGLHRMPRGKRRGRIAEIMELTRTEGLAKRYPGQLSGGQQQRVALARALAPSPGLILLDEPFSNLDTAVRGKLRAELRAVLKQTLTSAIIVTHDRADADAAADRVSEMSGCAQCGADDVCPNR